MAHIHMYALNLTWMRNVHDVWHYGRQGEKFIHKYILSIAYPSASLDLLDSCAYFYEEFLNDRLDTKNICSTTTEAMAWKFWNIKFKRVRGDTIADDESSILVHIKYYITHAHYIMIVWHIAGAVI